MNSQKPRRRRPSAAAPGSGSTQVIKINGERDKCLDHLPRYVGVRLYQILCLALDVEISHRRVLAVTADKVAGSSPALDLVLRDKRQTYFARSGATMLGILSQYALAS